MKNGDGFRKGGGEGVNATGSRAKTLPAEHRPKAIGHNRDFGVLTSGGGAQNCVNRACIGSISFAYISEMAKEVVHAITHL